MGLLFWMETKQTEVSLEMERTFLVAPSQWAPERAANTAQDSEQRVESVWWWSQSWERMRNKTPGPQVRPVPACRALIRNKTVLSWCQKSSKQGLWEQSEKAQGQTLAKGSHDPGRLILHVGTAQGTTAHRGWPGEREREGMPQKKGAKHGNGTLEEKVNVCFKGS